MHSTTMPTLADVVCILAQNMIDIAEGNGEESGGGIKMAGGVKVLQW